MRNAWIITAVTFMAWGMPAQAQYGWPPPNYSVTGVRAEDGCHYRNIRQVLHDHGCGCRLRLAWARMTGNAPDEVMAGAQLLTPLAEPPAGPNLYVAPRTPASPVPPPPATTAPLEP